MRDTQWGDAESLRYAAMCYSDQPHLYTGRGLAEGVWSTPTPRVAIR
ncbi:MAG: hypothetical protein V9E81_17125 [Marmoricola sp.]